MVSFGSFEFGHSRIGSLPLSRSTSSLQGRCLLSWCFVGACHPGVRSLPVILVFGPWLSSCLQGRWLASMCLVGSMFLCIHGVMRSVPLIRCSVGALSLVFNQVHGWRPSSSVGSAPFAQWSSWYKVGANFVIHFDVPCLPHSVLRPDIVSTVHLLILSIYTRISLLGSF